jgi:hypothetical protein
MGTIRNLFSRVGRCEREVTLGNLSRETRAPTIAEALSPQFPRQGGILDSGLPVSNPLPPAKDKAYTSITADQVHGL